MEMEMSNLMEVSRLRSGRLSKQKNYPFNAAWTSECSWRATVAPAGWTSAQEPAGATCSIIVSGAEPEVFLPSMELHVTNLAELVGTLRKKVALSTLVVGLFDVLLCEHSLAWPPHVTNLAELVGTLRRKVALSTLVVGLFGVLLCEHSLARPPPPLAPVPPSAPQPTTPSPPSSPQSPLLLRVPRAPPPSGRPVIVPC